MQIISVTASGGEIRFQLDAPVDAHKIRVSLFPAAVGEEGEICSLTMTVTGESFMLSRRLSGKDGITCRYVVTDASGEVEGKKYVEILSDAPDLPASETCVQSVVWDVEDVPTVLADGVKHAAVFVNLSDLLMMYPEGENTLYYRMDGRDYYVRKAFAEYLDACVRPLTEAGVSVTLVLLNAREWIGRASDRFWETVVHPSDTAAEYARFDTVRESGCAYFRAFVTFLAERYRPFGMAIGCDVNGMADAPLESFAEEYITALRVAYQCVSSLGTRVYAAIDTNFAEKGERGHAGRDLLSALAGFSLIEGELPWGVAVRADTDTDAIDAFLKTAELMHGGERRALLILPADAE